MFDVLKGTKNSIYVGHVYVDKTSLDCKPLVVLLINLKVCYRLYQENIF